MPDRRPLHIGAAYHGNRMPSHAYEDLRDMVSHGMDLVVHMLSHTDWERHLERMKDIVSMSFEAGLDVWIDNWGIGGPPGDVSHFLAYHPESHMILSDGTFDRIRPCVYDPEFRKYTKEWIDAVAYTGARRIFWDEPHMPVKTADNGKKLFGCACPACRKRYEERYDRPMPEYADETTMEFGADSIADYFREMTEYSHSKGIGNSVCVMIGSYGMSLSQADKIAALPYMDNIGSDPYWVGKKNGNESFDVYSFVRSESERNLALCEKYGRDHNIWVQTYSNPRGSEEDIILAADAIYDAGARTIIAWGYNGSESNNYAAKNPLAAWSRYEDAVHRLRERDRDRILEEARKNYRQA